jgi:hypothetical protein
MNGNLLVEGLAQPAGEIDNWSFPYPHSWHIGLLRHSKNNGNWTIVHHFP